MEKIFLILFFLGFKVNAAAISDAEVIKILTCQGVIECRGSSSYGGPCYSGYGGRLYDGPGGPYIMVMEEIVTVGTTEHAIQTQILNYLSGALLYVNKPLL